jgi:hypothetical protein
MYLDKYYLAYGTNMSKSEMAFRCPMARVVATGYLDGYKLVFKHYLTIEKCDNHVVPVVMWEIEDVEKNVLDKYESYPTLYHIQDIDLEIDGVKYPCFTYVMNDGFKKSIPSIEYYKRCVSGYIDFGFDVKYLNSALYEVLER